MPVQDVPPALMAELQRDLGKDEIDRGLRRLTEFKLKFEVETLKSSQAKDQWSAIAVSVKSGTPRGGSRWLYSIRDREPHKADVVVISVAQ